MAVNKTLYVRDEDAPIWDKARELAGESLSQFLTTYLKNFVATKDAEQQGKERIILQYRQRGDMPVAKSFYGRWIITPKNPFCMKSDGFDDFYALALTAKNNIVIFNFLQEPDNEGKYAWGNMDIYSSFDEARQDQMIPADLIISAVEKIGVEIEELDI